MSVLFVLFFFVCDFCVEQFEAARKRMHAAREGAGFPDGITTESSESAA